MQSVQALRNLFAYIFNEKFAHALISAWGQNNSPALHSTGSICRPRVRDLLWSAGTHGKALPLNAQCKTPRFVQRDGVRMRFKSLTISRPKL